MQRIFIQTHKTIPFLFRQNSDDFIVDELPVDLPHGRGNYLIARIEKRNLSTLEMLQKLEEHTRCHTIGYAGLKDKAATTTQYISMPLKFSKALKSFKHPAIRVLEAFRSSQKLGLGDLAGNRFFIRLHNVTPQSADRLQQVLDDIMRNGMPNYFGYQRFGRDSANPEKAREVAHGEVDMKDKKMQKLLTSAYQSYRFNDWLRTRILLSRDIADNDEDTLVKRLGITKEEAAQLIKQPGVFHVLPGDVMLDVQSGKWLNVTDLQSIRKPYKERKILPTGLMAGKKAWRAKGAAHTVEAPFDDPLVQAAGERRPAWVYPKQIKSRYDTQQACFELSFTLPKGAYATVLLENLGNRDLSPADLKHSK